MLLSVHPANPNQREIRQAAEIIRSDGVLVIPTDTIYAMACKLGSKKGIERLCRFSGKRPEKVHFSLLCSSIQQIAEFTISIDRPVFRLMKNNLPGPFTFILPASKQILKYFEGNKKSIGIRIPDCAASLALIEEVGSPLLVTTIHHQDEVLEYMTDPDEIYAFTKHHIDAMIENGSGGNIPSTIIDCTGEEPLLVRQGKGEVHGY